VLQNSGKQDVLVGLASYSTAHQHPLPGMAARASLSLGVLAAIPSQYVCGLSFTVSSADMLPACPYVNRAVLIIIYDDRIFAVSLDPIPSRVQIPALSASHMVSFVVAFHDDLLSSVT
jgi:hypothetical protein